MQDTNEIPFLAHTGKNIPSMINSTGNNSGSEIRVVSKEEGSMIVNTDPIAQAMLALYYYQDQKTPACSSEN